MATLKTSIIHREQKINNCLKTFALQLGCDMLVFYPPEKWSNG
jgi:hypothetical protein